MKRLIVVVLLLGGLIRAAASAPAKPAPKPPTRPPVKGTTQLAGDDAQPRMTYTLGAGGQSLNFTLDSAEFSVARVNQGNSVYAPRADEKLLVLNLTVQNPNKTEYFFDGSSLQFVAVDAKDVNHDETSGTVRAGPSEPLGIELKPAQTISVVTAVRVPALGPVPKLIVKVASSERVLRYDLRGKVKPLAAPIADPADASGVSARTEVPGQPGTAYPVGRWDLKFVSAAFSKTPLLEVEPEEGKRLLVVTFEATNQGVERADYGAGTFTARLITGDNDQVECLGVLAKGAQNAEATGQAARGQALPLRLAFQVPKGAKLARVVMSEASDAEMRGYAFDLAGVK